MSDKSKAEKLAAARKLLKEFQQKLPPKTPDFNDNSDTKTIIHVPEQETIQTSLPFENAKENITDHSLHQINNENTLNNPFQNIFQQSLSEETFYENLSPNTRPIKNDTINFEHNVSVEENINNSLLANEQISNPIEKSENENIIISESCNQTDNTFVQNEAKILNLLNQEQIKYNNLLIDHQKLAIDNDNLKKQLENFQKLSVDAGETEKNLQEQLKLHQNTIKVLVGEKTELNAQINKFEAALSKHNAECEELQGRLRAARHKAADSEKELTQCKRFCQQLEMDSKMLLEQNDKLRNDYSVNTKESEDLKEELSELKEKIKVLSDECGRLETNLAAKDNELSLSHLKIQQLTSGDPTLIDNNLQSFMQEKTALESKIKLLEENVEKSKNENTQVTQQYKQYCQQLNSQMQSLVTSLQEKSEEIEKFNSREKDLMNHMAELEKQLQLAPKIKTATVINENVNGELNELKTKYVEMEKKCEDLDFKLIEKSSELQSVTEELNESKNKIIQLEESLDNLQIDHFDATKLNAAIESDKIAAARSMAQNAELKLQIEELQRTFIQMSDYKLEITEKLNCEQHLGRELNAQVIKLENELLKLRTVLEAKDEEMIRLQNENTNLSKEVIQQAQLSDRLRHYEAKDNVTDIVQKELQQARDQITMLLNRNTELENMLSNSVSDVKMSNKYEEGYNVAKRLIRENSSESSDVMETIPENDIPVSMYETKNDVSKETVPVIATQEAMEKLQERFTKTMADIAELTDEKQRLEHLVLQLQSETETVGEYIALYQNQRSLLRQREIEKDNQLMKLAHDQEDMKNKLLRLNQLVVQLLKEREVSNGHHYEENVNVIQQDENYKEIISEIDIKKINEESNDASNANEKSVNAELLNNLPCANNTISQTNETAKKIIDLLSELKSSNLIHPMNGEDMEGFAHHCHCCSGRLLTV